ncbi:MAG: PP2C family protein-serine/threonine phosphatase [Bryobacteraceae bacterium]
MTAEVATKATLAVQKVLVVDDQPDTREALRLLLKSAGYGIETAESPIHALAAAAYRDHDLILVDMNYTRDTTSGDEGLRLLDRLRAQASGVPIIAMTGWSTIELAVEAMHRGACDFIAKPWENSHLLAIIEKHLHTEAAERPLDAELAIARKIQRKLLPRPHFSASGLDCECASLPAGEIGGDLYDFFTVEGGGVAFLLGDVCGSGIGAALLVANLQATIRSRQALASHPKRLIEQVNRLFFHSTRPEHFATLFFGFYDPAARTIHYVNCGHPPPVLLRLDGTVQFLEATGVLLGAFEKPSFEQRSLQVASGDRMVLYSDGFSEARDRDDDAWVADTIRLLAASNANGLAGALASTARTIRQQPDDISVMDIRVK